MNNNSSGSNGPPSNNASSMYNYSHFKDTKYKNAQGTPNRNFQPVPYTEEEHQRIQYLLDKVLGPEYVSFRPGGGGQKVSYIEGWRALNLANEIFGFNGWCSELISSQVDYFDTHGNTGRISMGLSVVVRITIKDGTYHEDFGYGYIDNAKNKAMAFEKCKKEAFTDGLKRCLRCFGNVLGNCLYDRTIISKIQKVRLPAPELEADNFHRDPLIAQREMKKRQTIGVSIHENGEGNTDISNNNIPKGNNDNETTNSNENNRNNAQNNQKISSNSTNTLQTPISNKNFNIPNSTSQHRDNNTKARANNISQPGGPQKHSHKASSNYTPAPKNYDIVGDFDDSLVFSDDLPMDDEEMSHNDGLDDYELQMLIHKNRQNGGTDDPALVARSSYAENSENSNKNSESNPTNNNAQEIPDQPALFVSAKRADALQQAPKDASKIPQFDAKYVSPNIRRTLDHSKSVPVRRSEVTQATSDKPRTNIGPSKVMNRASPGPGPTLTNSNTNNLGKRMIGLPPSQKPPYKRRHQE
ncbi:DNA repair and recombination protein RAD52 [Debaryomyces fabryi]|uniref:DNA repair and recombination protein RAD52 n=1 Tax=Debaryomyces fabryi TaxID=58627 RepID=A0A0V1Q7B2_9ASCO|nr:DNA repair and recombination protein RAD52 [Debaryomyces fabryi]KSA04079.1 DNA repair and recombination protein RAD52 [Debaryomyces fabryi]